jgi:competence protein ComEA
VDLRSLRSEILEYSVEQKRALVLGAVLAVLLSLFFLFTSRGEAVEKPATKVLQSRASETLLVHVAGEVMRPGVYPLVSGSRVIDAIKAAGGPKAGTDMSQLNLARILTDGEQIYLGVEPPLFKKSGSVKAKSFKGIVYINRATAAQFDSLPGVGPAIAKRIIEYRRANGLFTDIADLQKVEGIGPKTFAKMERRLSL